MRIQIQISPGELIDRLTILEIKAATLTDEAKLRNVRHELAQHRKKRYREIQPTRALALLERELKAVNQQLWDIEDAIREQEAAGDFGDAFIRLARAVYVTNDRRCALKRQINEMLESEIMEEKGYKPYKVSEEQTAPVA